MIIQQALEYKTSNRDATPKNGGIALQNNYSFVKPLFLGRKYIPVYLSNI